MAAHIPTQTDVYLPYPAGHSSSIVTEIDLIDLPVPVQRYMRYTGVLGKPWINTVRLQYHGRFRMAEDKGWMSIAATQVYRTNPAGFLWKAQLKIAGLPLLHGVDVYQGGRSHMNGKLLGLFTVVDGQGEEVNQGGMVRYLQEMTWFPIGYLGDNITWQAVDNHTADVIFTDAGKSVTGRMYFDDEGRLLSFHAERYGDFNGAYTIRTWTTPTTEYGSIAGLNVPIAGLGVWRLPANDFPYVDIRLTSLEYNIPIEAF